MMKGSAIGFAAAMVALLTALLAPTALFADDPDFQSAYDGAYEHYREASFHGRTGNTPVAALALDEFIVKWSALEARFADSPPAEYAGDANWKTTLGKILARAETGLNALDADDPEAAREAINPIRGILGDLRRRNNVVTFSDHVDALSAAMDVLARYRREVKDLGDAEMVAMAREQAAIVAALFEECRSEAASDVVDDPEFKRLVDGAAESMEKLRESLETGDILLYRIGIGELRSYERIMFLRFG
jgi:hypothetical protein